MPTAHTTLDRLQDAVGPEGYDDASRELLEMQRDARLMRAVYHGVGFDRLQAEFCGYDPAVLRVFFNHFHGCR